MSIFAVARIFPTTRRRIVNFNHELELAPIKKIPRDVGGGVVVELQPGPVAQLSYKIDSSVRGIFRYPERAGTYSRVLRSSRNRPRSMALHTHFSIHGRN